MSFCGSATAGLTGYSGTRAHQSEFFERLLELTQSAGTADATDTLDTLRVEADAILALTMREVEAHAVEGRALTAFTLTLDQARLAISDRRDALLKNKAQVA